MLFLPDFVVLLWLCDLCENNMVIWIFFWYDLTGRTFLLQAALAESSQFKEKLMTLQLKKDYLNDVLGEEKAESFLQEVAEASKEREILHRSLLQSKSKLQVSYKAHILSLPMTKIKSLLSQFYV